MSRLRLVLTVSEPMADNSLVRTCEKLDGVKYRNALVKIAKGKEDKYISLVDFLLCGIFTEFQVPCFEFYESNGKHLDKIVSKEMIEAYDCFLCDIVLEHCLNAVDMAWDDFSKHMIDLILQTK